MSGKVVRIGGGSGFWGDSSEGPRQLVMSGQIDYLIADFLAEITMSLLARAKERKPELGYATDMLTYIIAPLAKEIASRKIKVIVNAGGVNPLACRDAVMKELAAQGVKLKVAAVLGDDVTALSDELRNEDTREMWTGAAMPADILSSNAYTGAFPIAAALDAGADIVITGRCADSALALGPLIHEFGWKSDDFDRLAAGSIIGHVVECGPQATGGVFTDWRKVADGWANMGYPIAECYEDGSFIATKPRDTGGLVSWGTIAEQISYETGDPRNYVLPDVVCDLSGVQLEEVGSDRVRVTGIRGKAPTSTYKVSATHPDGFRSIATLFVKGVNAVEKAAAMGKALIERSRMIVERKGLGDFADTSIEILGAEDTYGKHARMAANREVVLKIGVRHARKEAVEIFSREIAPASTAMAQGTAGIMGGRPVVQPVIRLYSFLVEKSRLTMSFDMDGESRTVAVRTDGQKLPSVEPDPETPAVVAASADTIEVPLIAIAYGRSGDKGDISNIAVLARDPDFVPIIDEQVTASAVRDYLAHVVNGEVQRFTWPGLRGVNFLLHEALGGGGIASLRYDPQGKAHAQMLMDFPVRVPAEWVLERRLALD